MKRLWHKFWMDWHEGRADLAADSPNGLLIWAHHYDRFCHHRRQLKNAP